MADKRILFVCGSLEAGHDGVGDYTRALAGALNFRGFEANIIAIMDRNVDGVIKESQISNGQKINVIRISQKLSMKHRKMQYDKYLIEFNPQWLSLQYVPYAFSPKGIPLNLSHFLKNRNSYTNWHFMIHEVYIGANGNFKRNIIQRLQISALQILVKKLHPAFIQTSIASYQSQLASIGIESGILGLFGNIPISKSFSRDDGFKIFRGVYFGAPPPEERFQTFVNAINEYFHKTDEVMELVLCGQSGEQGKRFGSALRDGVNSEQFRLVQKGRMAADELSKLFLKMDFAVARIPPHLLGKSGSAIALLEHGLALWLPLAKSQDEIRKNFDFRINQCFVDLIELKRSEHSFEPGSRLNEIAESFIQKLTCIEDDVYE